MEQQLADAGVDPGATVTVTDYAMTVEATISLPADSFDFTDEVATGTTALHTVCSLDCCSVAVLGLATLLLVYVDFFLCSTFWITSLMMI